MKKLLITILILILVTPFFVYLFSGETINDQNEFDHVINLFVDRNKIVVNATDGLDSKKIKVYFQAMRSRPKRLIYSDDKYVGFPQVYGSNTFFVYYDDIYLGELEHHKLNNWYHHHLIIDVSKDNGKIRADADIVGPGPYKYREFTKLTN